MTTETIATVAAKPVLIKVVDRKATFGGEGTKRRASWDALLGLKRKTPQAYKAAGGAPKYLSRWEKAGLIDMVAA